VDGLKEILAVQEVEVRQKNAAADELIIVVSKETEKVQKEKNIGNYDVGRKQNPNNNQCKRRNQHLSRT